MRSLFAALVASLFTVATTHAEPLLVDVNGDGMITILAFGDSITYGVGDGTQPGQEIEEPPLTSGRSGYPARVSSISGVRVINGGVPGEFFSTEGEDRFPNTVASANPDVIVFLEGFNDGFKDTSIGQYRIALQRIVNVARVYGRPLLLLTLPRPCCNHAGLIPFTTAFSDVIRDVAAANGNPTSDLQTMWQNSCVDQEDCELFNVPEGLHPNSRGYDLISQVVLGALYGIDLTTQDGAGELESTLGLPEGSVIVKPNPVLE